MAPRSLTGWCLIAMLGVTPAAAMADPPAQATQGGAAQAAAPGAQGAAATAVKTLPGSGGAAGGAPSKAGVVTAAQGGSSKAGAGPAAKKNKKKKKGDDAPITGPIASYPGFRMLDGGGSRVSVALSKKVNVTELKAQGKVTYRIQGVRVPTRTNRLPLLTTYFATPVSRVELVERDGGDVDLVIDLRSATTPQHRIVENDKGVELQVDFPKVTEETATEPSQESGSQGRPATTKSLDNKAESAY